MFYFRGKVFKAKRYTMHGIKYKMLEYAILNIFLFPLKICVKFSLNQPLGRLGLYVAMSVCVCVSVLEDASHLIVFKGWPEKCYMIVEG